MIRPRRASSIPEPAMTPRWRAALLGAGVLLAAAASAAGAAPGISERALPVPRPAVTGHVLAGSMKAPPDTARCLATLQWACYRPEQLLRAYHLWPLFERGLDGRGRTIALVESFGSPTIAADLHRFDETFHLPDPPDLRVIHPAGAPPPIDPSNDAMVTWEEETTLDVEWAHVMAPGARLLLVETPVAETQGITGFPEIVLSENYVVDHHLADVISQSFGATEETFPSPQAVLGLRSAFENAAAHGVTVLSASGDAGATDLRIDESCCYPMRVNSWPSSDPLVTSVGGTLLSLDSAGRRTAPDRAWHDAGGASGGGLSVIFPRPDYQDRVRDAVGDRRGTPDVSMSAAMDGAVVIYGSFPDRAAPAGGWRLIGGTSEATPLLAGVVGIAEQAAGPPLGLLNDRLYALARQGRDESGIVDVALGENSWSFCASGCGGPRPVTLSVPGYQAVPGYDLATGLGTVDAADLVRGLAEP
jgi:subtilase family serine protease